MTEFAAKALVYSLLPLIKNIKFRIFCCCWQLRAMSILWWFNFILITENKSFNCIVDRVEGKVGYRAWQVFCYVWWELVWHECLGQSGILTRLKGELWIFSLFVGMFVCLSICHFIHFKASHWPWDTWSVLTSLIGQLHLLQYASLIESMCVVFF